MSLQARLPTPSEHTSSDSRSTSLVKQLPEKLQQQLMGKLRSGRDLIQEQQRSTEPWQVQDRFLTGFDQLDQLLDGGLARREMIEVIGRRTCGRFSLALSTLASTSQAGEAVALVDLGDHFDPQTAKEFGVDLERLLWLRPKKTKQALAGAEILLSGGFPLVVMDLGTPPVAGGRGLEAGWLRLARAAEASNAALLVTSPYRASGTAARAVLEMQRRQGNWLKQNQRKPTPQLLQGLEASIVLEKGRGRHSQLANDLSLSAKDRAVHINLSLGVETLAIPMGQSTTVRPNRLRAANLDSANSSSVSLNSVSDALEQSFDNAKAG